MIDVPQMSAVIDQHKQTLNDNCLWHITRMATTMRDYANRLDRIASTPPSPDNMATAVNEVENLVRNLNLSNMVRAAAELAAFCAVYEKRKTCP